MKGFFSVCPCELVGAIMYIREKMGNETAMRTVSRNWKNMFLRRNPGRPSYQIDARSCWTFGWVTNYKRNMREINNSNQIDE
jgi:hypothetical protein